MNNAATVTVTVHGVLAAAYPGKSKAKLDGPLLTHASTDDAATALCGRVKPGHLCDVVEDGEPTCKQCARKLAAIRAAAPVAPVKRGRGRPRNTASAAADHVVGVRLTPDAYARLAAAAAAANTSMSELLRGAWERDQG